MNETLFTCFILFLLIGCEKEDITPGENKIYFKGITITDIIGVVISSDTTDWRTDDNWSSQEINLFSSIHQANCTLPFNYSIIAYPNPGIGIFALHIEQSPTSHVELRLVDENFNKLISSDSITQNNIHLDPSSFGIQDTVRLYYKFVDNNCEYRGHGDIVIR